MNKKNITEFVISGILLLVLFILVISAATARKAKKAVLDNIGKSGVLEEKTPLEDSSSRPKNLFQQLEDQTKGLTLTRDPFIFAPMAVSGEGDSAFRLNGIFWDKQGPVALINDNFVKKGESIDSAIVVEIKQDRVILNDGTHTFEVKLE